MKKIRYTISNQRVWKELYDTKLDLVLNFTGIYKGNTNKECEEWLKEYKKGLNK